jgi:hypothetical protein
MRIRKLSAWTKNFVSLGLGIRHPLGRAMGEAVSRRPPTAEARVRSRLRPCGICGGQSGTGTGFSPSSSVFPCQFHSTGAPFTRKRTKGHPLLCTILNTVLSL